MFHARFLFFFLLSGNVRALQEMMVDECAHKAGAGKCVLTVCARIAGAGENLRASLRAQVFCPRVILHNRAISFIWMLFVFICRHWSR